MSPRPVNSGRKPKYNFQNVPVEIRVSKKSGAESDTEVARIRTAASMWAKRNGFKLTVCVTHRELGRRVQIVSVYKVMT